jgi:CheY-like chemotaxis protein
VLIQERMRRHILIVEDEPAFAEVLAELLADEGYAVLHVREGVSALNVLAGPARPPDLIVCDVMLPGIRGDQFAAEIRKRYPRARLPILLMSASADPRVELPDLVFMPKPFDSADLMRCIAAMIREPEPARLSPGDKAFAGQRPG